MGLISPTNPYPLEWENPVTVRAAAALPAPAGTWDAAPTAVGCAGAWWMRLYFTYTRSAAGGRFEYRYEVSPYSANQVGVQNWFRESLYVPGVLNFAADAVSNVQREAIGYGSTAAGAETFVSPPIHLAGCSERFRLVAREHPLGTTPPGTLHVVAVFYVEG